jgi:hypothetical protein
MSGMHALILEHVRDGLKAALIDNIADDDKAKAGIVTIGELQGDPTPDDARISVTLHENDPEVALSGVVSGLKGEWIDEVDEVECGGASTWVRRFSVKARCLLVNTAENLDEARAIASTVRERIEDTLTTMPFTGIANASEYVSRGILSEEFSGEMLQAGGPEAYDYHIKVRFSLLTTRNGVQE